MGQDSRVTLGDATLELGAAQKIAGLYGDEGATLNLGGQTLTVNQDADGYSAFGGRILSNAGNGKGGVLRKEGVGKLILAGDNRGDKKIVGEEEVNIDNAFTTQIVGGTVRVEDAEALGDGIVAYSRTNRNDQTAALEIGKNMTIKNDVLFQENTEALIVSGKGADFAGKFSKDAKGGVAKIDVNLDDAGETMGLSHTGAFQRYEVKTQTYKIQKTDAEGKPVYDASGYPVFVQKTDAQGKPVYDVNGKPVYELGTELHDIVNKDGVPFVTYVDVAKDGEFVPAVTKDAEGNIVDIQASLGSSWESSSSVANALDEVKLTRGGLNVAVDTYTKEEKGETKRLYTSGLGSAALENAGDNTLTLTVNDLEKTGEKIPVGLSNNLKLSEGTLTVNGAGGDVVYSGKTSGSGDLRVDVGAGNKFALTGAFGHSATDVATGTLDLTAASGHAYEVASDVSLRDFVVDGKTTGKSETKKKITDVNARGLSSQNPDAKVVF
ncbi:MAG: hypothetical protein HUK22_02715, partial [Thermoguttaceae bacterium]|nr:hypothetical protein [Thermoguttaceae bacterium]